MIHDRGWQSTSLYIGWLEVTHRALRERVASTAGEVNGAVDRDVDGTD